MNKKDFKVSLECENKIQSIEIKALRRMLKERDEKITELEMEVELLDKTLWEHKYVINEMRGGQMNNFLNINLN